MLGNISHVNFGKQLRNRKKFTEDVITAEALEHIPENYKPCYTGRNMTRYYLIWGGLACLNEDFARCGGCWDSSKQNSKGKILTRQIGRSPQFALDSQGYQCLNTAFMINVHDADYDPLYVLGVLNSALIRFFWLDHFFDRRRTFPKIKGTYLKLLPIPKICRSDPSAQQSHDHIVTLVEGMAKLQIQIRVSNTRHEKELLQRQIAATDKQIDQLVYNLYGLTEEEIRIVERTNR